ncbi:MAG: Ig-like domain-containing protein [Pseudomonadota bacterium]
MTATVNVLGDLVTIPTAPGAPINFSQFVIDADPGSEVEVTFRSEVGFVFSDGLARPVGLDLEGQDEDLEGLSNGPFDASADGSITGEIFLDIVDTQSSVSPFTIGDAFDGRGFDPDFDQQEQFIEDGFIPAQALEADEAFFRLATNGLVSLEFDSPRGEPSEFLTFRGTLEDVQELLNKINVIESARQVDLNEESATLQITSSQDGQEAITQDVEARGDFGFGLQPQLNLADVLDAAPRLNDDDPFELGPLADDGGQLVNAQGQQRIGILFNTEEGSQVAFDNIIDFLEENPEDGVTAATDGNIGFISGSAALLNAFLALAGSVTIIGGANALQTLKTTVVNLDDLNSDLSKLPSDGSQAAGEALDDLRTIVDEAEVLKDAGQADTKTAAFGPSLEEVGNVVEVLASNLITALSNLGGALEGAAERLGFGGADDQKQAEVEISAVNGTLRADTAAATAAGLRVEARAAGDVEFVTLLGTFADIVAFLAGVGVVEVTREGNQGTIVAVSAREEGDPNPPETVQAQVIETGNVDEIPQNPGARVIVDPREGPDGFITPSGEVVFVKGGSGLDNYTSQTDNVTLFGGDGDDTLFSFRDNNQLIGGADNDSISARGAGHVLSGGSGRDNLRSFELQGSANAGPGNLLDGGADDDFIEGLGNDTAIGGTGDDTIQGVGTIVFRAGDGNDVFRGFDLETQQIVFEGTAPKTLLIAEIDTVFGDAPALILETTTGEFLSFVLGARLSPENAPATVAAFAAFFGIEDAPDIGAINRSDPVFGVSTVFDDNLIGFVADAGLGDDTVTGSNRATTGAGNDVIDATSVIATADFDAGGGNDLVLLGDAPGFGSNTVDAGIDVLSTEAIVETDNDTVIGGAGRDDIRGGLGIDVLIGGGGDDRLSKFVFESIFDLIDVPQAFLGAEGTSFLLGEEGNDTLTGGKDTEEVLDGGVGDDLILSNIAPLRGGTPEDTLIGGEGDDTLDSGNTVKDVIVVGLENGRDVFQGFDQIDVLDFIDGARVISTEIDNGELRAPLLGRNELVFEASPGLDLVALEQAIAQQFNLALVPGLTLFGQDVDERLIGTSEGDIIAGNGGNDTLEGLGGNDDLDGGAGDDSLLGGDDDDVLSGRSGTDRLRGEAGDDTLLGGTERDFLFGGDDDDFLDGGEGRDQLFGGLGDDTLLGGGDSDLIEGDFGDDLIQGGLGNDSLRGGGNNDTVDGGEGSDVIRGEGGDDILNGNAGGDRIDGNSGNDTLNGGEGRDDLEGGDGDDTLIGGADNDVLEGEFNNDLLLGETGNDEMLGGFGNDTLVSSSGNDTLNGGENDDVFTVEDTQEETRVIIEDFGAGNDVLDIDLGRIADIREEGSSTVIELDGGRLIVLEAVNNEEAVAIIPELGPILDPVNANTPPVAEDDLFVTDEDTLLEGDLLADNGNGPDSDANGDPLAVIAVRTATDQAIALGTLTDLAEGGQLTVQADGQIDFDPLDAFQALGAGETALIDLIYTLADGQGGLDEAAVQIVLEGVNDAPEAADDTFEAVEDTPLTTGNVLANDLDAEDDALTVVAFEAVSELGSTVVSDGDGTFAFTYAGPDLAEGESILDSFTYTVSDGTETDTATVFIEVEGAPEPEPTLIAGTAGQDVLSGTEGDDVLITGGGLLDVVTGGAGADRFVFTDTAGVRDIARFSDVVAGEGDTLDLLGRAVAQTVETPGSTFVVLEGPDRDLIILEGLSEVEDALFV